MTKQAYKFLVILGFSSLIFLIITIKQENAVETTFFGSNDCSWFVTDVNGKRPPFEKSRGLSDSILNFTVGSLEPGEEYSINTVCPLHQPCPLEIKKNADSYGKISGIFDIPFFSTNNPIDINVVDPKSILFPNPICVYHISPEDWYSQPTPTPIARADCQLNLNPNTKITIASDLTVTGNVFNIEGLDQNSARVLGTDDLGFPSKPINVQGGGLNGSYPLSSINGLRFESKLPRLPEGRFSVKARIRVVDANYTPDINYNYRSAYAECGLSFYVCKKGDPSCSLIVSPTPLPSPTPPEWCNRCMGDCGGDCILCPHCIGSPTPVPPLPSLAPLCDQLPEGEARGECWKCIKNGEIWSAIGCLPTDFGDLLKEKIFPIGIGFAGGIAFLYFLYGTFIIMTSAGNPEKISEAKEIIISSLSGLLLIIFSVFLLRVIGVDILKIPGFG